MGVFQKEKANLVGKFITEFLDGIKDFGLEEVDITNGVSGVYAVKNASEQEKMLRAGNCCRRLMKNVFVRELESVMKSGRSVKHVRIADKAALSSSRHA